MKKEDSGELIDQAVAESQNIPLREERGDSAFKRVVREVKEELLPHRVAKEDRPKTWHDYVP